MRLSLVLFVFCLTNPAIQAQTLIDDIENELAQLGVRMINAVNEEARLAAADSFARILDDHLDDFDFFNHPLTKVTNLSKLASPDQNFRIYTWSVPLKNREFAFYGRLVVKTKKGLRVTELKDGGASMENPELLLLKPENWYGAVYYEIIKTKEKKKVFYTLLGYRPSRAGYNQKIIDVLNLDPQGTTRFGDKIFEIQEFSDVKFKRPPYRLIMRYSSKVTASLRWVDKEIVMDHLSPPDISLKSNWSQYGPDFSYDSLYWKEGKWLLKKEITVKMQ